MAQESHSNSKGSEIFYDTSSSNFNTSKIPCSQGTSNVCNYRVCPRCRPTASERTLLSLNAVANDEILPTAATGYGFHVLKERPVVDVRIWQRFLENDLVQFLYCHDES